MYSAITSNKRKTWILIVIFIAVIGLIGWFIDQYEEAGGGIVIVALIFSVISALFSYYAGDSVALWSSGAKEIAKKDAPDLYNVVENLCIADGLPTPKIYVIDDPAPNAFATGRDPQHASIAFTTGLLGMLNKSEIEGVAAHELSHIKNYDIRIMTVVVVLVGTIALTANLFLRSRWYGLGGRRSDRRGDLGGIILILGLILLILAPIIAQLIKLAVSRRREYLADASGALLTRYPDGLASALEKIGAYKMPMQRASAQTAHLFISNPFGPAAGSIATMFSTHPPIQERIKLLRQMVTNPNA